MRSSLWGPHLGYRRRRAGRKTLVLLTLDEIDALIGEIRVEVLDLLRGQIGSVQCAHDLVVCQEALLLAVLDELLKLVDVWYRDVDREH